MLSYSFTKLSFIEILLENERILMDIFESLENLNVSEECFDEIMGIVEELLSEEDAYEPAAYAKDGYNFMATGSNKLNGKLYKVHTKHDKGVTKTKLYAKDGIALVN